ncbi:MAG: response regulator [Acidobacteriota bacterium]
MGRKILLADDSITIQKVVELTFSEGDFDVLSVGNGEQALEKLREFRPDIALLDVIMPEKNGYEVCQILKQDPQLQSIPVLLLTGTFESFDRARADAVGADGYLTKPFESQMLISKVEELLASAPRQVTPQEEAGRMEVVTEGQVMTVDVEQAPQHPAPEPPPAPPGLGEVRGSEPSSEEAGPIEPTLPPSPPAEPPLGTAEPAASEPGPAPSSQAPVEPELTAPPPPPATAPEPPPTAMREEAGAAPSEPAGEQPPAQSAPKATDASMADEGPAAAPLEPTAASATSDAYEQTFEMKEEPETIALAGPRPTEETGPGTLYSGPAPQPPPTVTDTLTPEQIERIARRVVEHLSDNVLREVAWEIIPDLAEILIRKRISELERDGEPRS